MQRRFDPEKSAASFDNPIRDELQKPDQVIEVLGLRPRMKVADIGAGAGYFAIRLARHAAAPRVFAVDIEPKLLDCIASARPSQPETIITELRTTVHGVNGGPITPLRGWRTTEQEYFVQADDLFRPNLTINAGLRYSPDAADSVVGNCIGNLYAVDSNGNPVPGVGAFTYGPTANRLLSMADDRPLFIADRNKLQPPFGIAWNPRADGKTVLRAA